MKWFGRQQYAAVNGCETSDAVEVDRISFTSNSSEEGAESFSTPPPTMPSDPLDLDYLSASSSFQHLQIESQRTVVSQDDDSFAESSYHRSVDLLTSSPRDDEQLSSASVNHLPDGSSFHGSDCRLETFRLSPPIVRTSLFWFDPEEEDEEFLQAKVAAQQECEAKEAKDDDNSARFRTLCRSLQTSIGLVERTRWMNMVSADPELSFAVSQLDSDFPIAMIRPNEGAHEDFGLGTTTAGSSASSLLTPNVNDEMQVIRVPGQRGIDAVEIRRRRNVSASSICNAVLSKHFRVDRPRDRRIRRMVPYYCNSGVWINEVAEERDKRSVEKANKWASLLSDDWILKVHKPPNMKLGVENQESRCANCGASICAAVKSPERSDKAPRFCEYYGLYFCVLCHAGEKTILPAKAIEWNFTVSPVCDRASRFLKAVRDNPVLHLNELAPDLVARNRALKAVMDVRTKLKHMEGFIKLCPEASEQVTTNGNLGTMFACLDRYLLESNDVFSLIDLNRVHNKDLINHLEPIARFSRQHILHCANCSSKARSCVRCGDTSDRLFPFEDRIAICGECGALSHAQKCRRSFPLRGTTPECPNCTMRLRARQHARVFGST